jgi:hypothetical protein
MFLNEPEEPSNPPPDGVYLAGCVLMIFILISGGLFLYFALK